MILNKKTEKCIHVQLRLTPHEHAYLKKQSSLCGLKMEPYIKRLIMGKEVHPLPPDSHRELARELSAIGKNVNQIARVANSTHTVSAASVLEIHQVLGRLWDVYYGNN